MNVIPKRTGTQGAPAPASGRSPADIVRDELMPYLGPFTSKNAVQMMAKQSAGMAPELLTPAQIPGLLEALGPILRTLLGKAGADKVLGEIQWKLGI